MIDKKELQRIKSRVEARLFNARMELNSLSNDMGDEQFTKTKDAIDWILTEAATEITSNKK